LSRPLMLDTGVLVMMATGSGDMLPMPSSEDSLTVAGTAVSGTTTPINVQAIVTSWHETSEGYKLSFYLLHKHNTSFLRGINYHFTSDINTIPLFWGV
jgi:hypothetical protein